MNPISTIIDQASEKAGGVRALARALDWNPGSIMKAKAGEKISPYRAAQLADFLGVDPEAAVVAALIDTSKSDAETAFWPKYAQEARLRRVAIAVDTYRFLEERWASRKEPPSIELRLKAFEKAMEEALSAGSLSSEAEPLSKAG